MEERNILKPCRKKLNIAYFVQNKLKIGGEIYGVEQINAKRANITVIINSKTSKKKKEMTSKKNSANQRTTNPLH